MGARDNQKVEIEEKSIQERKTVDILRGDGAKTKVSGAGNGEENLKTWRRDDSDDDNDDDRDDDGDNDDSNDDDDDDATMTQTMKT